MAGAGAETEVEAGEARDVEVSAESREGEPEVECTATGFSEPDETLGDWLPRAEEDALSPVIAKSFWRERKSRKSIGQS